MRILAVGNMYPPDHLGGYELSWRDFVRYATSEGHEVRVLAGHWRGARHEHDGERTRIYRELRWYRDDDLRPVSLPLRERLRVERHNHAVLRRHLDEFRPQVVSWWPMGFLSLSLIESVRRAGLPAVGVVRDNWLVYGPKRDNWIRFFDRRPRLGRVLDGRLGVPTRVSYEHAARWLFISDYTKQRAVAAGIDVGDAAVVYSGLEPAFYRDDARSAWDWRLVYVGRVAPQKGVDTAVRALASLPERATLRIVGSSARWEGYRQELRQLAQELGVSRRVTLDDAVPHHELPGVYGDADVVVFPVRGEEAWGRVPLEAMASRVPVVATARGGTGEYLADRENCLVIAPDDAAGLAGAVRELADPELRQRTVSGGAQTAARLTMKRYGQTIERHLFDASKQPRAELDQTA